MSKVNVLNPETLENKKMLVICPSRDRVEKLKKMVKSFQEKSSPQTALLICIDEDDQKLEEYKELLGTKTAYHIGKRCTNTQLINWMFEIYPDFEYYALTNDDFVYLTACWDVKLMGDIKDNGGWGVSYGDDRVAGDKYPSHPVISGNIARAVGWLQLPSLKHLCGDWVWGTLSQAIGRKYYDQNVIIKHEHPFDKKTLPDAIFEKTNSKQMYAMDQDSYKRWGKYQLRDDISKILREIFKEKNFDKTVSLCMIIKQTEPMNNIKQCIDSVKDWIDELSVEINYLHFPNPLKINAITKLLKGYGKENIISIGRFKNFSKARNVTLKQATKDYLLFLDSDDVMPAPWTIKDMICRFPDIDVFNCLTISSNVVHKEQIVQPRLVKRHDYLYFRNNVHEDISYSFKENGAKVMKTDIIINHLGNKLREKVTKKNLRNYRLTMQEINSPQAHSLTYFALINELMLMKTRERTIEAINWIDKFFEKFPDNGKDPLVPKMWILRGSCALDCGQVDAARTNFAKAWHGWKHPEGGVMLGVCNIRQGNWDKAIEILEEINAQDNFMVCNIPIDMDSIELVMLENLGLAYYYKSKSILELRKTAPKMYNEDAYKLVQECFANSEKYLMRYLTIDEYNLTVADKLVEILRDAGKMNDANVISVSLVNMFPGYWQGWANLGQFELMNKRHKTAKVFFEQSLKINPKQPEVMHNYNMLKKMK